MSLKRFVLLPMSYVMLAVGMILPDMLKLTKEPTLVMLGCALAVTVPATVATGTEPTKLAAGIPNNPFALPAKKFAVAKFPNVEFPATVKLPAMLALPDATIFPILNEFGTAMYNV